MPLLPSLIGPGKRSLPRAYNFRPYPPRCGCPEEDREASHFSPKNARMLPVATRASTSHCLLYTNKKANTVNNPLGFGVGLSYDWSALKERAYLPPYPPR